MDVTKTFGARVRRLQLSRKMTQGKLAEEAGFHVSYISRLERGRIKRRPGLRNLIRLSWALKVGAERLVKGLRPDGDLSAMEASTKDLTYNWLRRRSEWGGEGDGDARPNRS